MPQIQEDLTYFLSYPYIVKVEVLKVLVNKLDNVEPKTYRWLGATKEFADGSFIQDTMILDKAWQMVFEYKAYSFDPNNEVPLECVPNAIFKMYGDKSKGKGYYTGRKKTA